MAGVLASLLRQSDMPVLLTTRADWGRRLPTFAVGALDLCCKGTGAGNSTGKGGTGGIASWGVSSSSYMLPRTPPWTSHDGGNVGYLRAPDAARGAELLRERVSTGEKLRSGCAAWFKLCLR